MFLEFFCFYDVCLHKVLMISEFSDIWIQWYPNSMISEFNDIWIQWYLSHDAIRRVFHRAIVGFFIEQLLGFSVEQFKEFPWDNSKNFRKTDLWINIILLIRKIELELRASRRIVEGHNRRRKTVERKVERPSKDR